MHIKQHKTYTNKNGQNINKAMLAQRNGTPPAPSCCRAVYDNDEDDADQPTDRQNFHTFSTHGRSLTHRYLEENKKNKKKKKKKQLIVGVATFAAQIYKT